MGQCRIYYWDNGVGVKTDVALIKECLDEVHDCEVFDFSSSNDDCFNHTIENNTVDIGIFNQNYDLSLLHYNKINVFIPNEEWLSLEEASNLNSFDYIIVKNSYAKNLFFDLHKNIQVLYFWSRDLYSEYYSGFKNNNILHFAGKSIQKNTESVISRDDIHIFDSSGRFKDVRTEKYYYNFISDNKLQRVFNTCNTHVCPSLYEAHGHYMFEAMLCNKKVIASAIPAWTEQIDPSYLTFVETNHVVVKDNDYEFLESKDSNTKFPWRRGFITDTDRINYAIDNSKAKKPRKYTLDLFSKNKKTFLEFFKSI